MFHQPPSREHFIRLGCVVERVHVEKAHPRSHALTGPRRRHSGRSTRSVSPHPCSADWLAGNRPFQNPFTLPLRPTTLTRVAYSTQWLSKGGINESLLFHPSFVLCAINVLFSSDLL